MLARAGREGGLRRGVTERGGERGGAATWCSGERTRGGGGGTGTPRGELRAGRGVLGRHVVAVIVRPAALPVLLVVPQRILTVSSLPQTPKNQMKQKKMAPPPKKVEESEEEESSDLEESSGEEVSRLWSACNHELQKWLRVMGGCGGESTLINSLGGCSLYLKD